MDKWGFHHYLETMFEPPGIAVKLYYTWSLKITKIDLLTLELV